jgi:hypothetical protein
VLANEQHVQARAPQHLNHEQAKLAIAQDRAAAVSREQDLLQHLKGGGEWLHEDRLIVRYLVWNNVEIACRQDEELGVAAIAPQDTEHRATLTVSLKAAPALQARAAGCVDLTDDPSSRERGVWSSLDTADELVSWDAAEAHVAAGQLEIGIADASPQHPHERFIRGGRRRGDVVAEAERSVKQQRAHAEQSVGSRAATASAGSSAWSRS